MLLLQTFPKKNIYNTALLASFVCFWFYKVIWDLLNDDDSLDFRFMAAVFRMKTCASMMEMRWINVKKLKNEKERKITSRNVRLDLIIAKCAMILMKTDFGRWVCSFFFLHEMPNDTHRHSMWEKNLLFSLVGNSSPRHNLRLAE